MGYPHSHIFSLLRQPFPTSARVSKLGSLLPEASAHSACIFCGPAEGLSKEHTERRGKLGNGRPLETPGLVWKPALTNTEEISSSLGGQALQRLSNEKTCCRVILKKCKS